MTISGFIPEIFLISNILLLTSISAIQDYINKKKTSLFSFVYNMCIFILIHIIYQLIMTLGQVSYAFNYLISESLLKSLIQIIFIFFLLTLLLSFNSYLKKSLDSAYEYLLLILLALLGTILIVKSNDLTILYLGIELQALSSYILASSKKQDNYSTEAGLKYFILGSFSSALILYGISLIYASTGTTSLNFLILKNTHELQTLFYNFNTSLAIFLIFIGLFFKVGGAPFHVWLPDVYEGAPLYVMAIFAVIPKIAFINTLLNLIIVYESSTSIWTSWILLTSITSLIIGTLGALMQTKLKRLLAFSAITHIGFILLACSQNQLESLFAVYFYFISYMILSLLIFAIIIELKRDTPFAKKHWISIYEISLLLKPNKSLSIIFILILFSVAGIPPLMGFFSKYFIFAAILSKKLYLITLTTTIISVIAAFYYIRLIKLIYFNDKQNEWIQTTKISKINSYVISLFTFITMFFFINPQIFITPLFATMLITYNNIIII